MEVYKMVKKYPKFGGQSCGNFMHKMQDAAKHDIFGN